MLYGVAGVDLGQVRLHAGVDLWAPSGEIRPVGGVEWTPRIYPRTTVFAATRWRPPATHVDVGARYRVSRMLGVELVVEVNDRDVLDAPLVLLGARYGRQ